MGLRRGIIENLEGSWGSGIAVLSIRDSKTGKLDRIPCENAPTVRVFEAAFGGVITSGHRADGEGYKGKEIFWSLDDMGLMFGGFVPVDGVSEKQLEKAKAALEEEE